LLPLRHNFIRAQGLHAARIPWYPEVSVILFLRSFLYATFSR